MAWTSGRLRPPQPLRNSPASGPQAFTIVELLISISVLAVLVAIAVPAIRAAAQASRAATCLATIRGANRAIAVHTNDHKGLYPYLPKRPTLDDAWDNAGVSKDYFSQFSYWPRAMLSYLGDGRDPSPAAAYCPWSPHTGRFRREPASNNPINIPADGTHPTAYYMSSAMFSNWRLWTKTPVVDQSVLVPVRVDEVTHPSKKLGLIEGIPWHLQDRRHDNEIISLSFTHAAPIALADGSARLARARSLTEDGLIVNPFYPSTEPEYIIPWIHTRDGAKGRDLK